MQTIPKNAQLFRKGHNALPTARAGKAFEGIANMVFFLLNVYSIEKTTTKSLKNSKNSKKYTNLPPKIQTMWKRTIFAIILALANACAMLWLTFYLLSITQVLPDEYELVRWSSITKNIILGMEKKPDSSRFLLVNVCWDKLLIDKFDESLASPEKPASFADFWTKAIQKQDSIKKAKEAPKVDTTSLGGEGLPLDTLNIAGLDSLGQKKDSVTALPADMGMGDIKLPMGSVAITDRAKLVALLKLLHRKPNHKALLIDVFFKDSTPYDSALTALINSVPRTVVSSHLDDQDKPELPDLKIKPIGISNLEKSYGQALKFRLHYHDTIKTTPIRMYEIVHGKKFKKGRIFYELGGKPILNSFILDYRMRKFHYDNQLYAKVHLGEWITPAYKTMYMPCVPTDYNIDSLDTDYAENFVHKLTKDKIIVVGDFEDRDIHETIYGETAGPMILLDAFLAIEAGDNLVTVSFLLMLFLSYFFISFVTFRYQQIYPKWIERLIFRKDRESETFFETFTIYLLFFATLSLTSYFLFNIHVGVLVLAFYMNILEKARKHWIVQRIVRMVAGKG